jgi:hypothetical protein
VYFLLCLFFMLCFFPSWFCVQGNISRIASFIKLMRFFSDIFGGTVVSVNFSFVITRCDTERRVSLLT